MDDQLLINKQLAEQVYKQSLEHLEQKRRIEAFLYGVSEAVFVLDPQGVITFCNKAFETLIEKPTDQIVGMPADDVISLQLKDGTDFKSAEYSKFNTANALEITQYDEVTFTCGQKTYYVNVRSSVVENILGPKESVVTLINVTKQTELERAQNDFIAVTSHELRTPLTIIRSYLWMLENGKGGDLNDRQLAYLKKAISGTDRMLNLINDSLNVSRIEQNKVQVDIKEVNIVSLLDDIAEDYTVKCKEKNLEFIYSKDPSIDKVFGDENKVREIILNLLGNSFKFTDMGSLTLKLEKLIEAYVRISVTDTGVGITPEDIPHLFKKFGRLENSYQNVPISSGTGLGLYIVKNLVDKMGGTVGVVSEGLGKGSTFWITLPTYSMRNPVLEKP